jgi:hypothetical protein
MSAQIIKTEIDIDPLTRGYSGMSDREIADDMNTKYRERNRTLQPDRSDGLGCSDRTAATHARSRSVEQRNWDFPS